MDDKRNLIKARVGGQIVQVEVAGPPSGDQETDVGIKDVLSFDGLVDSLGAITEGVTSALQRIKPDKATLEFGVDVGVEAGALTALLVKGTGTATLKITLEWSASDSSKAGSG